MSKRVNPRRRPLTMADLERAKKVTYKQAVSYAMAIIFTALKDKKGMTDEELREIWNAVNSLSESVSLGYVSVSDLQHVLLTEYGIEV